MRQSDKRCLGVRPGERGGTCAASIHLSSGFAAFLQVQNSGAG